MDLSTLMPQQRDIVTTLDRPLFVSAGAGSGKTFTLTRRILWALSPESGPFIQGLDQVLAITFTKDAAAEIRERVRGALIEAGMDDAALQVDDAWISTIHGMCARILRAHALELGLDPEFTVMDESVSGPLMDRAVDAVIARERGGLRELQQWYPLSGETDPKGFEAGTSVKRLVRALLERASASARGFDDIRLARGAIDFSGLMDAYRLCLGASPKAGEIARIALDALEAFLEGPQTRGDLAACMLACGMPRASKAFPKEQVDLLKAEAADAFINAYLAVGGAALDELLALARAVGREYAALKAERSALDNNDLLRLTYEALRDHPGVREAYAGKFALVMIDEFQDTDQQQVDLVGFLTGEGGRALCTVGDAQQSIYRFRGAEVEVFRRAQRRIEAASAAGAEGSVVKLVKNFRSHAEVLEYVARVFDDEQGGVMPGFLNLLAHEGRKDGLVAEGASRRRALLVAGGSTDERTAAKAAAIACRFRELADAGQPAGGMVLLLGGMPRAGVYAEAIRAEGLDCVISGGSVFAGTEEARTVRALVHMLGNLADTAQGLAPVLASPLFALGVQEFLALATKLDDQTGETSRRNIDAGIMSDCDVPGLRDLPLLTRAREVLRYALRRVGRDSFAAIVRDAVNASGWFVRLAQRGPEGKAIAANVLKALDAVAEAEAEFGNSPRSIALAFDRFLAGKEAPGALNEEGDGAVRIMTVHASKGLEYPVVAVAECFGVRKSSGAAQMGRVEGGAQVVALPARFDGVKLADGTFVKGDDVKKQFEHAFKGKGMSLWLPPELMEDVCATGSPAEAFARLRNDDLQLSLEERARLLYVAMTRARELVILAMDAGVSRGKLCAPIFDVETDLTYDVLRRILPTDALDMPQLDADRLVFDNSKPGDYELISLSDFTFGEQAFEANASLDAEGRLVRGDAEPEGAGADARAAVPGPADPEPDAFELVYPQTVGVRMGACPYPARDSYSYSSIAAALHAESEDRAAEAHTPMDEAGDDAESDGSEMTDAGVAAVEPAGNPMALGSAFHAACQWLIEMGADALPTARADALARLWRLTPEQRERFDVALDRWLKSAVRAELLAWPCVRAEVPFFSLGCEDEDIARYGAYAEGAIDALATNPADSSCALVIDYKTGGTPDETPEQLQEKHALQARVYADVLHKAGFEAVTVKFVRVEQVDLANPCEPQVVTYSL